MKILNTLALICLTASASQARLPNECESYNRLFEAANLDEWGLYSDEKNAIIIPDTDGNQGGNSFVLDPAGSIIGPCPYHDGTVFTGNLCTENWNISEALIEVDWTVGFLSSQLRVTDYTPSSKPSKGFAYAGWWIIPNYDAIQNGETAFDKSNPINLTDSSTLQLYLSYTKDETLTLQLKGVETIESGPLQSLPRFDYKGKGDFDYIRLPIKAFKRPDWSLSSAFDISKVNSIGMLRVEEALTEGASFPSSRPITTELRFISLETVHYNTVDTCQVSTIIPQLSQSDILNQEVEVYSLQGEKLSTQIWTGSLKNQAQGLYLIKFDGQVMKYNHP